MTSRLNPMESVGRIRKATAEDAAGLGHCMAAAYAAYRQRLGGARLPPMDADYRSEIDNYPTWVVEVEGRILGGLIMTFGGNQASIANIAVDPEFQGQGIGGELMRFAESKARDSHASELSLATHVLLDENISLYRHLGWEESGRDASRVFMKKSL